MQFKKSLAAMAVLATLSLPAIADTGGLRFKITNAAGQPVVGALVHVSTPDSLTVREGITDKDGFIRLVGLSPSNKYEIKVNSSGYSPLVQNGVKVVSGKNFSLSYALTKEIEKIAVTGTPQAAMVDTTSSVVGIDVTLDMTEALPTGRSYQAYLQLAPGTKPTLNGNPSSKSGVNYSDFGGANSSSSDNVYYIDNINVTDNNTGTFGANFNSEIIQEQQILTGGIPAEFDGGSGLVSRVVTKSGSNEFHGSINYYTQSDSLVADDKNKPNASFKTYDAAYTLGGPIIKDKLWFYTSYQVKNREDNVSDPNTGEFMRTVENESNLGFAKLTWQPTNDDKLVATFFNDPTDISGSRVETTLNNRDLARKQGGNNYKFEYSHMWDDFIVNAEFFRHEAENSILAANPTTRADVAYLTGSPTNADTSLGGLGSDNIRFRNRDEWKLTLEYFLDTNDWGSHAFKFGYANANNDSKVNSVVTGDGSRYSSVAGVDSGLTLGQYTSGGMTGTVSVSDSDYANIINAMNASADSAYYHDLLDSNGDGAISNEELNGLVLSNSADPYGNVAVYRSRQVETAPNVFSTEGTVMFAQDAWSMDNLTVNAGLRAEKWDHIASDGTKVYTFDWEIAPRLSVIYDINDDGESKVWGFYGRYYDPIRTDMTAFAGTLTGSVTSEEIYIGDRWLNFRTRGGRQNQDALFAPTTKTPYTDEFMLGYSTTLSDDMSIQFTYTERKTRDLLEDYDLHLYTEELAGTDYHLPLSYFGYDEIPASNYVIATLAGGKRDYRGAELTFRKHRTDNWMALASFTYNDAKGNSNSDGNADFQGDVVWLDPRAPHTYGKQPGNISYLFKLAASYYWDNGVELGAVYNWNSGTRYSNTFSAYGRHLPMRVDQAYEAGGYTARWLNEDAIGADVSPSYGTLDIRLKYTHKFDDYKAEFFLDIFNVLDDQAATGEQDLIAGDGVYAFGEANSWVAPRRLYLGARLSF